MYNSLIKSYLLNISQNKYLNTDVSNQMDIFVKKCNTKKYMKYLNNFITMLCHFIQFDEAINIYNMLRNKIQLNDLTIINYIKSVKLYKNTIFEIDQACSSKKYGNEILVSKIKKNLNKLNISITPEFKYLDLCCGNGNKTNSIAENLKIKNIYGTDIESWGPYSVKRKFNFDFRYIKNDKLMFENKSFDLITCFLSLHHIPKLKNILKEIHRILKPNGIILILEHDLYNMYDKLLVDIQHKLFACLYDNNMNYIENPIFSRYFNFMEWDFIIRDTGKFKFLSSGTYSESITLDKRYDSQFYAIYKRREKGEKDC